MATIHTHPMLVRLMDTMVRSGSLAACSLAPARGITAGDIRSGLADTIAPDFGVIPDTVLADMWDVATSDADLKDALL